MGQEKFWASVFNASRVVQQVAEGKGKLEPDGAMVKLLEIAREDLAQAISALSEEAKTMVSGGPISECDSEKETEAMLAAIMIVGCNDFAMQAETLGAKVHFRLLREEFLRKLQATGSTKWGVSFAPVAPLESES